MFQDIKQNAILPFMQKVSSSLFFSLEQQLIINLINKMNKTQYEIDQKSLEVIHRKLINLLKEDANNYPQMQLLKVKEFINSIKLIPQNIIGEITKDKIPLNITNTNNSTWRQIIFSGSQQAMNRKLFWQIENSHMVTKSKLKCLIIGYIENGVKEYIKDFYPHWEVTEFKSLNQNIDLKDDFFHLTIVNFYLSQNPSLDHLKEIKRLTRDDVFIYDFIQYKDNPALYQSIRQLEALSLIKINYHYEELKICGEKTIDAFLSKIIVNPKV